MAVEPTPLSHAGAQPGAAARTAQAEAPTTALEADVQDEGNDNSDGDSALHVGGDGASETDSLASSILRYRVENGRTYHAYKSGAYYAPNDDRENERLELQHNLCILTQGGKLHASPIGDNYCGRVLDAGCGTGVWSLDFADDHPEATIVGTDLSPIQPEFVSPNVEFFVDDIEAPWAFSTNFDFVYLRFMAGCIKDWPKLMTQAFENLNPGGYIEMLDASQDMNSDDNSIPPDCSLLRWNNLLVEASEKIGSSLGMASTHKQRLIDAGFVNVVEKVYKWPINDWPRDETYKEIGTWVHENVTSGLQAISLMLFTKVLGWSVEEVELFLVGVRKDLKDRRIHAYWPVYTVYGQKPE